MDRFDEALQSYGRAVEIKPDDVDPQFNALLCCLLLGDFENGWEKFE